MDWTQFATRIGSVDGTHERCSTMMACAAIEELIGDEIIRAAFNAVFDFEPGAILAEYVLVHLHSAKALDMAYERYRTGDPLYRPFAVAFMAKLCQPRALDLVPVFLADAAVVSDGLMVWENLLDSPFVDWGKVPVLEWLAIVRKHATDDLGARLHLLEEGTVRMQSENGDDA